jgi:6-phosphogluconolactonase
VSRKREALFGRFLRKAAAAALVLASAAAAQAGTKGKPEPPGARLRVYVGTYTGSTSRGIYKVELDASTGAFVEGPALAGQSENPSFLALHPGGRVLYAVNEVGNFRGAKTGAVSAFAVDPTTGSLTLLNQQPSEGADPCHLAVDPEGRSVVVANYSGGSVAVLPLDADGRLLPAARVRHLSGSGPNASRQQSPHAHGVYIDPSKKFLLTADLGSDRVLVERRDAAAGTLADATPDGVTLPPGSGPRHAAFDPSGRFLYVINELFSTVTAFRWDAERGRLEPFQTIPAVAAGFSGDNKSAEIAVSPDGRFVYVSNRGEDSITVFRVNPDDGKLKFLEQVPAGGKTPRHFAIDPTGRWLFAANQDSNSISLFRIDRKSGRLTPVNRPLKVVSPVCVSFVSFEQVSGRIAEEKGNDRRP